MRKIKFTRETVDCIVTAAEKEGFQNIYRVGKKRCWHNCIWSSKFMSLFLYNTSDNSTHSIRIK